jgi:hypothetical protein
MEDMGYGEQSQDFALKLNKAQSAAPGLVQPIMQRTYSLSMGHNDPARIQAYPMQNMHMHDPQVMSGNPFGQAVNYPGYERECYSPDVSRGSYIETPEYRRFSTNENMHHYDQWNGYGGNLQPQMYPSQIQPRQSAPEIKMNLKSDGSLSSTIDRKSNSLGEDNEQKSAKDSEDLGVGFDLSTQEMIEKANDLAKDQSGCRMLQKLIADGDKDTIHQIYNKILPNFVDLMNNPFGNYLCQKITEACGKDQINKIIEIITKDVVSICQNAHGTRAIQKIIECSQDQDLIDKMACLLKPHVRPLVEDINGNHVIQKILFTFKAPNNEFIFETMIKKCREIACHKHGCCVMQKCIDGANEDQKFRLIDEIIKNTLNFVRNPFGNYVLQYVLEQKDLEVNSKIGKQLLGSLLNLSKHLGF